MAIGIASLQLGLSRGSLEAQIRALFLNAEQGVWYDYSDFSTLFQDSAGTTPVTAVGQPVGLLLDKRYGLVRGAELATNGSPFVDVGWTKGTGVTISGGTLVAVAVGATSLVASRPSGETLVSGKSYEILLTISQYTSGSLVLIVGGTQQTVFPGAAATFRLIASTTATSQNLQLNSGGSGFAGVISSYSVREIPGNHATQATAASRAILTALGAYYAELFDGVDDSDATTTGGGASTAAFICIPFRTTAAGVAQTLWSDRTGNTGLKLEITAANALTFSGGNGASINTVTGSAVSINTDYVATALYEGGQLSVQLSAAAPVTGACALSAGTAGITRAKDNGAASGFFKGYIYGTLYRKDAALTASQVAAAKRYMGQKAGVTGL